jgi:hypothetical protein
MNGGERLACVFSRYWTRRSVCFHFLLPTTGDLPFLFFLSFLFFFSRSTSVAVEENVGVVRDEPEKRIARGGERNRPRRRKCLLHGKAAREWRKGKGKELTSWKFVPAGFFFFFPSLFVHRGCERQLLPFSLFFFSRCLLFLSKVASIILRGPIPFAKGQRLGFCFPFSPFFFLHNLRNLAALKV